MTKTLLLGLAMIAAAMPAHAAGVADVSATVFLAAIFVMACFVG